MRQADIKTDGTEYALEGRYGVWIQKVRVLKTGLPRLVMGSFRAVTSSQKDGVLVELLDGGKIIRDDSLNRDTSRPRTGVKVDRFNLTSAYAPKEEGQGIVRAARIKGEWAEVHAEREASRVRAVEARNRAEEARQHRIALAASIAEALGCGPAEVSTYRDGRISLSVSAAEDVLNLIQS